jgi:hypothetical protein
MEGVLQMSYHHPDSVEEAILQAARDEQKIRGLSDQATLVAILKAANYYTDCIEEQEINKDSWKVSE